jgi:hypothetical protein
MTTPIDTLLGRLDKVRQVKPNTWMACCPAHDDKSPSLKVSEAEDGRVLVKCWAGCTTEQVVGAAGLELRDLFVSTGKSVARRGPSRRALLHEKMICRVGDALLAEGKELDAVDRARYELARQRLGVR